MITITIPKELTEKGELVVIPRKEYEGYLRLLKKPKKKLYSQLDTDLDEAIEEYRAGKSHGPFDNAKDLIKSLKNKR